jgi:hypothetical protein
MSSTDHDVALRRKEQATQASCSVRLASCHRFERSVHAHRLSDYLVTPESAPVPREIRSGGCYRLHCERNH